VVLNVDVLRFARNHRIVGEFHGLLVIFVDCRGVALPLLVDIVHKLPKVRRTLSGPAGSDILRFRNRESNYHVLRGSQAARHTIEHYYLS
jgi:hypothetical protein